MQFFQALGLVQSIGFAAVPPSVRKASGFPSSLCNSLEATPRTAKPLLNVGLNGKPEAFRTGGGKAAQLKSKLYRLTFRDNLR